MNPNPNRFHQIEHDTSRCDCDMCQFARNSAQKQVNPPLEALMTGKGDAGFLVPEAENVSQGDSGAGIGIPAPDFEREWEAAVTARKRYTEKAEAEHWFMLGAWSGIQYERARALVDFNDDLKEIRRVAGERLRR